MNDTAMNDGTPRIDIDDQVTRLRLCDRGVAIIAQNQLDIFGLKAVATTGEDPSVAITWPVMFADPLQLQPLFQLLPLSKSAGR